ncbi:MAG: hypothetical protein C0392_03880 [Syntrophus sp. (in: bacteria)]|nr:hypothetical protein [Syntrophus sp. (in: bacteria)]
MKAILVTHQKVTDEQGNTIEVKVWRLSEPKEDKPHGYRYSLAYIVDGERVVGYDNGEGKGDHRHYGRKEEPYFFESIDRLFDDFLEDVRRYKK